MDRETDKSTDRPTDGRHYGNAPEARYGRDVNIAGCPKHISSKTSYYTYLRDSGGVSKNVCSLHGGVWVDICSWYEGIIVDVCPLYVGVWVDVCPLYVRVEVDVCPLHVGVRVDVCLQIISLHLCIAAVEHSIL